MKRIIISVVVAFGLFLSAFLTSSAMAGGFTIGIIGAAGQVKTEGHEVEGSGDKEKTIATPIEESIKYGSIFAEYSFGEMYGVTLGVSYTPLHSVIGTKSRTDTNTLLNHPAAAPDDGTYTAKADISDHTTIYIEPTFMPTDNFGLYLKGGVSRITVNSLESISLGEDSSIYGNEAVLGGMFGLGAKIVHDSGFLVKFEYTQTIYETVKMSSTSGNANIITADPEIEAFRLAVGYKF